MRCAKIKLTDKKDGDKRTVPLSLADELVGDKR